MSLRDVRLSPSLEGDKVLTSYSYEVGIASIKLRGCIRVSVCTFFSPIGKEEMSSALNSFVGFHLTFSGTRSIF